MAGTKVCDVSKVYIEGKRTIQPVDWISEAQVSYYVGSQNSNIQINDFRQAPNLYAIEAIHNKKDRENFYQHFSKPARVVIRELGDTIQIDLKEPEKEGSPILWLGVSNGGELPEQAMEWVALRSSGDHKTAFVALVPQEK